MAQPDLGRQRVMNTDVGPKLVNIAVVTHLNFKWITRARGKNFSACIIRLNFLPGIGNPYSKLTVVTSAGLS